MLDLKVKLKCHAIGVSVRIADDIPAVITAVCVRSGTSVTYECVWWDGRNRKCEWLTTDEIEADDESEEMTIGFKGL